MQNFAEDPVDIFKMSASSAAATEHIPESTKRGITLRGLRQLQVVIEAIIAKQHIFSPCESFDSISTSDVVHK